MSAANGKAWGVIASALCAASSLSVHAAAPPGRYTLGPGTVLDNVTLLTWQSTTAGPYAHPDAVAYFRDLGSGWRLPNMTELQSLLDDTRHDPAIDRDAFPNTPGEWFWALDAYTDKPGNHWKVDFKTAYTIDDRPSVLCRVRCVR